jgi:ComF family protein
VNRMIWAMKFKSRPDLAHCLGCLLGQAIISRRLLRPECLIPVPLHRSRLASRGYNQSLEIARAVSRFLRMPLDIDSCRRTRKALPQIGMAAHKRRANISGVFIVTRPLGYTHVAIVDDVVTTGSTVYELAEVLRRAGVRQIDVWACARTASGA